MSFYVTLPSNASMKIFPRNNPSKFSVKLAQPLDLNEQYEVGLAEIQFPNSYFNVREDEVWVHYYHPPHEKQDPSDERTREPPVLVKLPPGLYNSVEDFVDDMNRLLSETNSIMEINYNKTTKRASIRRYERGSVVALSDALKDILALDDSLLTDQQPEIIGTDMVDLDREMKNVYLYTDIVATRPVGDALVPLLRSVPILDRASSSVFRIYDKPHYIPLSRFSFDTVEVLLTNDHGKTIPFTSGTSVVTLHFRKRKPFEIE